MKETCYCKQELLVGDKFKHLLGCTTALYRCRFCNYEGGQVDFMIHVLKDIKRTLWRI